MAGERTFTEGEAYALVGDAVERETAAATTKITELEGQITSLENERDVAVQRATAAEEKVEAADKALEDYKAEVETQKAAEAKRDERLEKLTEVAPKLVEAMSDERQDRIVAMADDVFDEYLEDLRQTAGDQGADDGKPKGDAAADKTKTDPTTGVPRESAAFKGGNKGGEASKPGVASVFGARRAAQQAARSKSA